jgi:hypothetical protein
MKTTASWLFLGLAAALTTGCTLTEAGLRGKDKLSTALGEGSVGSGGQRIVPKRCVLKMMIAVRPQDDEALRDTVWQAADCQAIGDGVRQALAANGLRIGVITGELPSAVQSILDAPPPHKIDPTLIVRNDGEPVQIPLGGDRSQLDLMISRAGRVIGKTYKDAKGQLRIVPRQADPDGVTLRIVPELHHGPVRQGWQAAPGGGAFAPYTFVSKNGQEEESLRELAVELALHANQVAVLGAVPGHEGSLGAFLFHEADGNSDRLLQKVVFLWASRTESSASADLKEAEPPDMPARPEAEGDSLSKVSPEGPSAR